MSRMSVCQGRGECFQQCCCSCYDDAEYEIPSAICSCGHRNHEKLIGGEGECDIYCQTDCPHTCVLIECKHYKHCGGKYPEWYLDCHRGKDVNCDMIPFDFLDEKDECPVCYDEKYMVKMKCNHTVCLQCLYAIYKTTDDTNELTNMNDTSKCPLCRAEIHE